jgi:copper chaperone NosL
MDTVMTKLLNPRILVGAAALLMVLVYFTPLWSIGLVAPQYRDGLGMYISISEVRGHDTHDLQNINILNHYIGMQPIEPDAIPELEWMPKILGALIIAGLLAAIIGNRWLMAAWLVAFVGLGIAGMVDFYMWKVDYGHNLSPDAPIKVPGMTYQPPLIGTKQLLNITASSYPHLGTYILLVASGLGLAGVIQAFRRHGGRATGEAGGSSAREGRRRAPSAIASTMAMGLVLLVACGGGDERPGDDLARASGDRSARMVYGQDVDPFCGRVVDRVRWGGEIRTSEGDQIRFRSVECLAGHLLANGSAAGEGTAILVVDFPDGYRLIPASEAVFLHTPNLASPDRLNLLAIHRDNERMIRNLQDAYTGPLLDWSQVLELVESRWHAAVGAGGCIAADERANPVCG